MNQEAPQSRRLQHRYSQRHSVVFLMTLTIRFFHLVYPVMVMFFMRMMIMFFPAPIFRCT